MMNEDISFDEEFDNTLAEVLNLSDEELLNLPDNPVLEMVFDNFELMNEAYLQSQGYLTTSTIVTDGIKIMPDHYNNQLQFYWCQDVNESGTSGLFQGNDAQTGEYESDMIDMTWICGTSTESSNIFTHTGWLIFANTPQDITVFTNLDNLHMWCKQITYDRILGKAA